MEELLQKFMQQLWTNALALTKYDEEEAKDLLQDTMLKILTNSNHYIEQGTFLSWSKWLMHNIYINKIKSQSKQDSVSIEDKSLDFKGNDTDVNDLLSYDEIYRLINKLPEYMKETFQLYIDGYSYQEIADKLNVPIGTVRSRIFSSRNKMQNLIDHIDKTRRGID